MVADGFSELIAAARSGDDGAITSLFRAHHPTLLRVLRAEVGDAAEDVAQQTWVETIGALERFEGDERGFRALLFTIGRRRIADHRRLQRRRPATPTAPDQLPTVGDSQARGAGGADTAYESDEAVRRIAAVLTPAQAEVVLLRVVAGLSVDEVAAIVGRSPGAVRVQQHRALRRLADALAEEPPGDL